MCRYADEKLMCVCAGDFNSFHSHICISAYSHIKNICTLKPSVTKTSIVCHKNNVHHNKTILPL